MSTSFTPANIDQSPKHKKQGGWLSIEVLGAILFVLIMIAASGVNFTSLFSSNNLADTEQALATLRMQIKQLYTSSPDYTGLTTASANKSGIIPNKMIKSNGVRDVWNGAVTIEAGANPNTFVISLAEVPQEACTKLATYQSGSWVDVKVNGSTLSQNAIVSDAANQCTDTNTLAFTSN